MNKAVLGLIDILNLEQLEENLFRGIGPKEGWQRVFGGQVIGQALVAATRTVEADRPVHSMHCYFVHPGDPKIPIVYEVKRIRDGRSFTTRYVEAIQHGRAIFTLIASFHAHEPGLRHQPPMPDVPMPEETAQEDLQAALLQQMPEPIRNYFERERPVELRPVDYSRFLPGTQGARKPSFDIWIRATAPLPDDPAIHRCVLGYASDMTLLDTSLAVHGRSVFEGGIQGASLDHAMWFHRPFRADEWLLYSQESPFSGSARGLSRGLFFTRDGLHVATVAQEGLIRPVDPTA
ncbi:acyl-CoA thioesterase II [Pseudochelatococcus contaminans]|uniref:Acyl-CoA thioesterase 2 n=1 Tax=Pseudochelatococcus contaminans TaxID=1538103 RepID=A0A7W5Z2Z2_9HYPH|nr:acyl-CoA thioesterase II [Pseudochelatococcus contaminans]MBB3808875.1 acyl-CoA thioesterase-2 [Pseudochelatococcus contaminans]